LDLGNNKIADIIASLSKKEDIVGIKARKEARETVAWNVGFYACSYTGCTLYIGKS
jgi:hypothetical protein